MRTKFLFGSFCECEFIFIFLGVVENQLNIFPNRSQNVGGGERRKWEKEMVRKSENQLIRTRKKSILKFKENTLEK